ncbi:MAG: phenylacetate--CoA ligase family protein, partial [Thermodesulfobacteriota bacterium]
MYWNQASECCGREDLERLQLERLQGLVERVYRQVSFYRNRLEEAGIGPEDIRSLDDLQKIPFTTKADLRDNYPFGLFAVPMDEIIRLHASTGTTGKPTVVGYTRNDIETWAEVMARTLVSAGAHKGDIIQIAYGYGLFTGGLGAHYGAEKIGAAVVPVSTGNTKRQITLLQDFGTTVLCSNPSYA